MTLFDASSCRNLDTASQREWLETNGIGGFASSTICGLNTRRYHGLLVASLRPPGARYVLLSKTEETFVLNGRSFELGTNRYPGAIYPEGYLLQSSFRQDPFPVFTWQIEDIELHKSLFLVHGENTVVVRYLLRAQGAAARHHCTLHVRPLIAFREFHQLTHRNGALNQYVDSKPGLAQIQPYGDLPPLYFAHDAEACEPSPDWYRNVQYSAEQERGLDFEEDLFQPMALHFDLARRIQAAIVASTKPRDVADAADLRTAERDRRKLFATPQTDTFLVTRGTGKSIIAGYHWFDDWSRDTMVSLPGLLAGPGQRECARAILLQYAEAVQDGMLPNRFTEEGGKPEYNTVDATLWFFEAIRAVLLDHGDREFVRQRLFPVMEEIVKRHLNGTCYGIRAEDDGLLHSGEQLTWMDARVNGVPVTPRAGKAVEIQGLWYNALCIMADLEPAGPYAAIAAQAKESFLPLFWNESAGHLHDVINPDGSPDSSLRPNQILTVALKYKIVNDPERVQAILGIVERNLLTPYGLRTLAPSDPRYRGRYQGGVESRDSSYHQGPVWPWLLRFFIAAYLDGGGSPEHAHAWLQPLVDYRDGPGLGNVPELFDGDEPHLPRGAIAQAWSAAALL